MEKRFIPIWSNFIDSYSNLKESANELSLIVAHMAKKHDSKIKEP